jgi:hypothetical protein
MTCGLDHVAEMMVHVFSFVGHLMQRPLVLFGALLGAQCLCKVVVS